MDKLIKYKMLNGKDSTYKIVEENGIKFTIDDSVDLLVEAIRPRIIDDLILTKEIKTKIKNYLNKDRASNLLLYSASGGCVDKETEYLTPNGWKKICDYDYEDQVCSWNEDGSTQFDYPDHYIKNPQKTFINFKTKHMDMQLSPAHRIAYQDSKGNHKWKFAIDMFNDIDSKTNGLPNTKLPFKFKAPHMSGVDMLDDEIRLMMCVSAENTIQNYGREKTSKNIRIQLKHQYKKDRLKYLLEACDIKYSVVIDDKYDRYYFEPPVLTKDLSIFWGATQHQLNVIVDEIDKWDGGVDKKYRTTIKSNADFIQYAMQTVFDTKVSILADDRIDESQNVNGKTYTRKSIEYIVNQTSIKNIYFSKDPTAIYEKIEVENEFEYCFTMPNGNWIARRNDKIFLTKNSGKDSIISVIQNTMNLAISKYNIKSNGGISEFRTFAKNFIQNTKTFTRQKKALYLEEVGEERQNTLDGFKAFFEQNSTDFTFFMSTNSMANISQPLRDRFDFIDLGNIPISEKPALMKQLYFRLEAVLQYKNIKFESNDLKKLIVAKFPHNRDIIKTIDLNTFEGVFEYNEEQTENKKLILQLFESVNKENYYEVIPISKQIEPLQLLRFIINVTELKLLQNPMHISLFIDALTQLNIDVVSKTGAFGYIGVLTFVNNLIKNKIKIAL